MDHRGAWSGTPTVNGAAQSGNSINISTGANSVSNYARKGDFVQFSGFTKVYQVTADANTDVSGNVTLSLNGAIPSLNAPADTTAVVFGNSVQFKLALLERPEPKITADNIAYYSAAKFQEVIQS